MSGANVRAKDTGRKGDPPPPPEPLDIEIIDSHCHLDLMDAAPADAVAAARAVGIRRMVTVGVDLATSRWQAEVSAEFPDVYAAVAIHPNEAARGVDEATFTELTALARRPEVRAVGETGLDYFRTPPEQHAAQQASFRRHIAIAKETGRPLMIHDREAHDDTLRILAEEGAPATVVFHAFSGDAEMAKACAAAGYVMSFAGNVTFKNAEQLREAAAVAPRELLLVETDAPFLTPMPFRGRPNSPYLVPLTLRAIAEVRGEAVDELAATVAATAERVFGPW
ncbi:TatD family hydrolase [Frankia sp. AgB1.9]|uniref:TatD family hydrolase n=1 Tax=unclassified Frankia TaxID=2632575 RepID=UPI001933727A|nr:MULTISPECIES: TatD family hydrolase [unclassified Frankia]MBL7490072.1 TatD family hydrolase [Frankia sp. AgW1.1]MBL7547139.1 TatD family hydrolase [Frankia sp. AgB1.9]MBL7620077.1 TatD family hydrolase [Frankia sp. AgB1.8]